MGSVVLWLARGISVLLGLSHGYFLATVPAHWSEDRWREDAPYPRGSTLDASDSTGIYQGCFSAFLYSAALLRHGYRQYGWARLIAPSLAFVVAAIGWPLDYAAYREVHGYFEAWPFLLLFEPCLWVALGSMTFGYLAGRLLEYASEVKGRH